MLKIIDVSIDILYERANAEKRLLALVNATVSHEMRNPINSINSQNIKQDQINEKFKMFIKQDFNKISPKKIKKRLKFMYKEYQGTLKVSKSSAKILTFLVNDILDFAQLRSGKFRKNISCFSIQEAIKEVDMIQEEKAEYMGIKLSTICEGFPENDGSSNNNDQNEFMICSDMQRI